MTSFNKILILSNQAVQINNLFILKQNNSICSILSCSYSKKNSLTRINNSSTKTFIRNFYTSKQNFTSGSSQKEPHETNFTYNTKKVTLKPYVHDELSYVFGRSSKECKNITFKDVIDNIRNKEPNARAVVVFDESIDKTYEELDKDVDRLINGFINKLNLKKGDKVVIFSYNNYQFLIVQYACLKMGLILNPFNPSCKANEFYHVLGKSEANVLFMAGKNSRQSKLNDHWSIICDKSLGKLQEEGLLKNFKDIILLEGELEEKDLNISGVKVHDWESVNLDDKSDRINDKIEKVEPGDIYGVYYTSGTTGAPKGAVISQFTALNNAQLATDRLFMERGPTFFSIKPNICLPLPLFHEFAGVLGTLAPLFYGGTVVFIGIKYDIRMILDAMIKYHCNSLFLTPTILFDLIGYVVDNKIDTKSLALKFILVGGSSVMPELINKTYKTFENLEEVRVGYGSSENGVIATMQTTNEKQDMGLEDVGIPIDFSEIKIVDTKTGLTTPLNELGEIQTRGFNTMLCYFNEPKGTKLAITNDRWYKTGDLGTIDKSGSLKISGRIKDLIIKGGENIYPAEVEAIIHTHEAIDNAYVIGVPDKRYGEEVCSWIKLNKKYKFDRGTNAEDNLKNEIKQYCRNKMAYNKVPKYILFVDEFPLTPVKKVKKFEMVAQTINILNLK